MKRLELILILVMAQGVTLGAGMPTPTVPKVLPNTPYGAKIRTILCRLLSRLSVVEVEQAAEPLSA